jgi:hypothetical protein
MWMRRTVDVILIILITPLGFATKFYSGPAAGFVHHYLGGVLYVIFWMLVLDLIFVKMKPIKTAWIIFLLTSLVEFLQLWHPPFLETLRRHFLGATLLGTTFTWFDFPWYAVGAVLGYAMLLVVHRFFKIPVSNGENGD